MKTLIGIICSFEKKLDNLTLLFLCILLVYGFYKPAIMKLKDIGAIGNWFESMGYPLAMLSAYLAAAIEELGVILLAFGLAVRIISVTLIIVMLVAILIVYIGNGIDAGDNGFEIPLYYIGMLLILIAFGAGKYSRSILLDKKNWNFNVVFVIWEEIF